MRIKVMIASIVVFALATAIYAFNQNHSFHLGNADCCMKKSDSCPMKEKTAKSDNSRGGKDCPMKAKMSKSGDGENCPMKDKKADSEKMSCNDDCPMKADGANAPMDECPMGKAREPKSTGKP